MALDDDQRQLETVKLCIDYLKHLTTLCGAATIVVLTLMQLPDMKTGPLWFPAFLFGLATIICVLGMVYLISGFAWDILPKRAAGIAVVVTVAGMFTAALIALIIGAFIPNDTVRLVVNGGLAIALLLALRYLLRKYRR